MLHREFAVDPKQVQDLKDFNLIDSRFGFDKGAVISDFPRSWLRQVGDQLSRDELLTAPDELTELLKYFKEKALVRFGRSFQGGSWIDAAMESHEASNFHRVVDESKHEPPVFTNSIHKLRDSDFYTVPEIERRAEELARISKLLLRTAEKVSIVDPYFCLCSTGYRKTLTELMKLCEKQHVTFCIYTEEAGKADWDGQRKPQIHEFINHMPDNIALKWFSLDDGDTGLLHQRLIYTAKGGIIYDRGFSEPGDWDQRSTPAALALMTPPQLQTNFTRFNESQFVAPLILKNNFQSE